MSTRFSIYCNSLENTEYLRQIIETSGTGKLVESHDLAHLPSQVVSGIDVFFLEYQENNPELDHWIEKTAANPRSPAIFLYFREISTNKWKTIRLGARECFTFPIQEEDIQQAIKRLADRMEVSKGWAKPTRVISFLGCKGGVGTSFLVANLASLLAKERRGEVLLLDLDMEFNQIKYFFDVNPLHTIADLIGNIEQLDHNYLKSTFCPIGDNLYLLPAPVRLEADEVITPSHLEKIISYLKENLGFCWILIDCCHQLDEITLKAIEFSDYLMLVTAQSIPALSTTKKMLEILGLLELKGLEVGVLVNYWNRQHKLNVAEVESFLGKTIVGTIMYDYQHVSSSIDEGRLLVETSPRHSICKELKVIAGKISQEDTPKATHEFGWRWLQRLWSKKKP